MSRSWKFVGLLAVAVLAGCASTPPTTGAGTPGTQAAAPQVPTLAVSADCGACVVRPTVPGLIQQGFRDAAAKAGVQVAPDKQTSLTIKDYADRNDAARFMVGIFAGKDAIQATVAADGKTFVVEDYYRNAWLGIEALARKIGEMTFAEIN